MKRKNKGFTILEIIAVIVIIGIVLIISSISVVGYIENSKTKTYESFKEDLRVASDNLFIDCMINDEEGCIIPDYGNDIRINYEELVEKGYSYNLKDPEEEGFCDKSYVIAKNTSQTGVELDYQVCLFCNKYKSTEEGCIEETITDEIAPQCDYTRLSGSSKDWTKENKVITIGCTDYESGCVNSLFSKSIGTSGEVIEKSKITIRDNAGNTTVCEVDGYVDQKKPTCELEVEGELVGDWYKQGVKVNIKSTNDEGSGVLTTGMGTSLSNRNYDGSTSYAVDDGIVTVFGYVKDVAGNEGYCSKQVKVDGENPEGTIYMGYQVYPKEEVIIKNNVMTIKNVSKYGSIKGIVISFNKNLTTSSSGYIYGNGNNIKVNGAILSGRSSAIFKILAGQYDTLEIDLGVSDITNAVTKVEVLIQENETSIWTNKPVSVYVEAQADVTGVSSYSYDNGVTFVQESIKTFDDNTTGQIIIKDKAENTSAAYDYTINKIDKISPDLTIENPTSGIWVNYDVSLLLKGSDGQSGLSYYSYRKPTDIQYKIYENSNVEEFQTPKFEEEGNNLIYIKVCDIAGNCTTEGTYVKIDKTPPYTPALSIDEIWDTSNVEDGTFYKTVYDLYCELSDGTKVYPSDIGGVGSSVLSKRTDEVICYMFVKWDGKGSFRKVYYTNADPGGSGIDWDASNHRFGSGTYDQLKNHHSWGTTAQKDVYHDGDNLYNHGSTASQLQGCSDVNIAIEQYYAKDKAGNEAENLLSVFTISSTEKNLKNTEKSLYCLYKSTYYFEKNAGCIGELCTQYDLQ